MDSASAGRRKRRGTGARGKLRRFDNVESVIVEEPFELNLPANTPAAIRTESGIKDSDDRAGDGYYVSATVHNRRYYGVLVDQAALKAASLLHFHDEARSLDLNRRMKVLKASSKKQGADSEADHVAGTKRTLDESKPEPEAKRSKTNGDAKKKDEKPHPVQKFQHVEQPTGGSSDPGYRVLLATYASVSAAAENESEKVKAIEAACKKGGDFVGDFYYQYQVLGNSLSSKKLLNPSEVGLRTSLGFDFFLQNTHMPPWFPLSNLQISQHKVLSILQMKRNNKGGVSWNNADSKADASQMQLSDLPMETRTRFRVGVIGGGIAGLSCAKEILSLAKEERIEIEVVVLEGRSRLGGRILTDESTFKYKNQSPFPVDLGASWIHGIDHNPLAALARDAATDFIASNEEVKMIGENLRSVDRDVDEKMGKLFDTLLDQAAEDVWEADDYTPSDMRNQCVVRWYARELGKASSAKAADPSPTDAPPHRHSSDVSIDHAIGKAVAKHNLASFKKFGAEEHTLLMWNTKNIEYALGANISDLSMKFWDSDERHAFEGDHVMLRQGYSSVIRHLEKDLKASGDKFRCMLNFDVGKVEYARKTTTLPYVSTDLMNTKLIELSDTCCLTSRDGEQTEKFDFLVSTLPLGVLKASIEDDERGVEFDPPLPFTKVDAIRTTGFGLLNKVYLQFPSAFWRLATIFDEGQNQFGNASGFNSHHYMFFDAGKGVAKGADQPAVLMVLISGTEAVTSELLGDNDVVGEVVATLRHLFPKDKVPDPIAWRVTRWGTDKFSRGCYTFLPPGATDQDFQILQSPVNGNGDSLTLEGSETMRLFWAGEHTTSLHPSMAHGAMLSGIRAAKEVVSTINLKYGTRAGFDKQIPLSLFRKRNPSVKLQCNLCHLVGSRVREGSLLAFQRGTRQVLVHNNCGESSPEVEVQDGQWKSIIKAINRGKQINCCMCGRVGATVGCTHENCFRSFHFSCAEDTGWRFERDGKVYFCDMHRTYEEHEPNECDRISLLYYRTKHLSNAPLRCCFCNEPGSDKKGGVSGKILAFQQKDRRLLVHDFCARYTTIMETTDEPENMNEIDFKNLFEIKQQTKNCAICGKSGATIKCFTSACDSYFHHPCALKTKWNFSKHNGNFTCEKHRETSPSSPVEKSSPAPMHALFAGQFQHNLFSPKADKASNGSRNEDKTPSSLAASVRPSNAGAKATETEKASDGFDDDDDDDAENDDEITLLEQVLCDCLGAKAGLGDSQTKSISRPCARSPWGFALTLTEGKDEGKSAAIIDFGEEDETYLVKRMNGTPIGSAKLHSLSQVFAALKTVTTLDFEIQEVQSE